ncbi:hypothetical protein RB653_003388 [Dictyostelium firmibasis]|uniref:BTB domain-containing protein n=1 Tax=Dictyostelium firmibasis TaxID=79012 RepID=A0AAN7Z2F1_9MYCE
MDTEQKLFFKEISDLFKLNQLFKAVKLINNKLTTITDNNEFKYKLILILGKLCLKGRNVDKIIPMIENELKTNEIKGSIKYNLMALLYRCYYLKSSSETLSATNKYQYKSKITTNHCYSLEATDQGDNISDMALSRNRSVSIHFINETDSDRQKKRMKISNENDENGGSGDDGEEIFNKDSSNSYYDDLNFQYYLKGTGLKQVTFRTPIKSISCGRYFSSALDNNGMIWNWGMSFEICSNSQTSPSYPYPIDKTIKSISAGHHHCIALATDGSVYTWGINNFGALGLFNSSKPYNPKPSKIDFNYNNNNNDDDDEIVKVAAGGFNSAFITKSGKLLVCGNNNRYQLGTENISNPSLFSAPVNANYIPSILVASSSITRDYSYLINNKQFSDLHISFNGSINGDDKLNGGNGYDHNIVYCHIILLTSLDNQKLLDHLVELKSKSIDNIVRMNIVEFLNLSVTTSSSLSSSSKNVQDIKKVIIDKLINENQLFPDSFIDFISFIYTNTTSKRNIATLLEYSQIFEINQLKSYINDNLFNTIKEESDLSLPIKLFKSFNNEYLSDCSVVSKDRTIKIKAHKSILVSRLNYFKKLLVNNDNDNINNNNNNNEIELDIPNGHLIPIIAYLYCDRIKFDLLAPEIVNGDYVLSLCKTCETLKLTRFNDGLFKLISQSVNKQNAISLLSWSEKNGASELIKYIKCFISLHHEFLGLECYDGSFLPFPFKKFDSRGQFLPIHVATEERFVDVAVGAKLMLALTSDNKLYQLGYGSDGNRKPLQQLFLPSPDENTKIKRISCGSSHWIAITENNNIYGMGCGDLNQLVEGSKKFCFNPTLISDSNQYNNAKAGFYASMYWNDLSNFPLHPNGLKVDIVEKNKIDKPVTIEVYNDEESSSSSSLWFFKNYDSTNSLLDDKLSGATDQKQIINDQLFKKSIISTTTSSLPPYLLELFSNKENSNDNTIQLFGFSKDLIEKSFLTTAKELNISSGDEVLELLFLSTSFGNYNLSNELFGILKKSINIKQACLLLTSIYNSNYSLQLSFLFNFLLGYLGNNRLDMSKDPELIKLIPISLLDLIVSK